MNRFQALRHKIELAQSRPRALKFSLRVISETMEAVDVSPKDLERETHVSAAEFRLWMSGHVLPLPYALEDVFFYLSDVIWVNDPILSEKESRTLDRLLSEQEEP